MNYRWSKNDRKIMQEIIDCFKMMLEVENEYDFLDLANERKCPFCDTGSCFSITTDRKAR